MQDSNALPISDPWFCYALHLTRAESCDESEICLPDAGVWGARKTFSLIIAFEVCTVSDAHHASRRWSIGEIVRREKALDFSGCNSRPGTGSLHPVDRMRR